MCARAGAARAAAAAAPILYGRDRDQPFAASRAVGLRRGPTRGPRIASLAAAAAPRMAGKHDTVDRAIETLKKCQIIPEADVTDLCERAKSILSEEKNVHMVPIPATVVGDIHGQFYLSLIHI